jgi:hypothetical protein
LIPPGRRSVKRLILALPVFVALGAAATPSVAATPPGASTGGATSVAPQTATLNGRVNPHGRPTAFYFRYGTTTAYGKRTSTGGAGSGTHTRSVSAGLTGLRPNTTYHYRLVAFSTAGTQTGGDRKFKTRQIPTTSSIAASPNPAVFGAAVSVAGALTGPSVGGKLVALQSKPFPFTAPFQQVGNTVVTTPQGGYSFLVPGVVTSQLRVVEKSKPSVTSQTITENIALATTLHARRSRSNRHRVRFYGRVSPARVGNAVLIQRKLRRRWKTIGLTLTRGRSPNFSVFSKRLRLGHSGRFRVVVRTTGGDYVDGTSPEVRVRLRHRRR